MKKDKEEAAPIAQLFGDDRNRTVGWVYLWNTSELSILWIGERRDAKYIKPTLHPEILATAKSVTSDAVTELLEALSKTARPAQA